MSLLCAKQSDAHPTIPIHTYLQPSHAPADGTGSLGRLLLDDLPMPLDWVRGEDRALPLNSFSFSFDFTDAPSPGAAAVLTPSPTASPTAGVAATKPVITIQLALAGSEKQTLGGGAGPSTADRGPPQGQRHTLPLSHRVWPWDECPLGKQELSTLESEILWKVYNNVETEVEHACGMMKRHKVSHTTCVVGVLRLYLRRN